MKEASDTERVKAENEKLRTQLNTIGSQNGGRANRLRSLEKKLTLIKASLLAIKKEFDSGYKRSGEDSLTDLLRNKRLWQ